MANGFDIINLRLNHILVTDFCYFPFMQMLLQPTGDVSPCCWNQKLILGNVNKASLEEIWNGEPMRRLRREFLNGQPESCTEQMRCIGCHKLSSRPFVKDSPLAEVLPQGPRRLDLRLNGRCNLQCVMCDVWRQPNGTYNESNFWSWARKQVFPWIEEIDVLGGEPLIQKDTFRLIEEVSRLNQKARWAFVTNGQYRFDPGIRIRLDQIELNWIQLSLDSVDERTYSGVRKGGQISRALETLDEMIAYRDRRKAEGRGFRLLISMCVLRQNWLEIPKFAAFAVEKGVSPTLQFAFEPAEQTLVTLPMSERRAVLGQLLEMGGLGLSRRLLWPIVAPLVESLEGP